MKRLLLGLALSGALAAMSPPDARASILQTPTARDDMASREVERGLVLGKGWFDISIGFSWKDSRRGFVAGESPIQFGNGNTRAWKNNGRYVHRVFRGRMDWGLTRNSTIWMDVPLVWHDLSNDLLVDDDGNETKLSSFNLGDASFGWRNQWVRTESKSLATSFATDLYMKTPSGNESTGTYIGGPNNVFNLITGTGTYELGLLFGLRQQLAVVGLDVWVGYAHKSGAVVQWLIDTESNQFNARVDPGDEVHFNLGLLATIVPAVTLRADLINSYRMATRAGTSSRGIPACKECEAVPRTAGLWSDVRATISYWRVDFPLGIDAFFEYTLAGRNSGAFWPLEDLSPSHGWTAGGEVFVRF
jgi:hypothetical protein